MIRFDPRKTARALLLTIVLVLATVAGAPVGAADEIGPAPTLSRYSGPPGLDGVVFSPAPCPAPQDGYDETVWTFLVPPGTPDADVVHDAVSGSGGNDTDRSGNWDQTNFVLRTGYESIGTDPIPPGTYQLVVKCGTHRPWSQVSSWDEIVYNKTYRPVNFTVTGAPLTMHTTPAVLHPGETFTYTPDQPCPLGQGVLAGVELSDLWVASADGTTGAGGKWGPMRATIPATLAPGRYYYQGQCSRKVGSRWEVFSYRQQGLDIVAGSVPPARYKAVALGDSFSAGEGVGPYFEPANQCHRSKNAYATRIVNPDMPWTVRESAAQGKARWGFQACSGATTADVLSTGRWGDPLPQLALERSRDTGNANDLPVDASTDLVTITIGGNDVGFAKILQQCFTSVDCTTAKFQGTSLENYITTRLNTLGPVLDKLYARIHAQAGNAVLIVAGYPQLLPKSPAEQNCGKLSQKKVRGVSVGLSQKEQNFLRGQTSRLNQVIADHVSRAVNARFAPVDRLFAGHEVCGNSGEWIFGPSLTWTRTAPFAHVATYSFHPNTTGQFAYAQAVNDALDEF